MAKISLEGWMVRYPSKYGDMLAWTSGLAITQRQARRLFVERRMPTGTTWKDAYRQGCRVVPVRIKEI